MTTRADLRAEARSELNDNGAAPLWPDERLDQWLVEAIRDYSLRWPRQVSVELASVADQAVYALPAEALWLLRVEHPQGVIRVEGGAGAARAGYEVFAGQLLLAPAPAATGEPIALRYLARYAEPADDAEPLATPEADDQVLVWYVCWRALGWISADEAKRQRFERQRGATAADEAQRYRQLSLDALAVRGSRFQVRGSRLEVGG